MRACLPLLPAPGEEVVAECLDEIESLRQQLAAALAVCKLKDSAIQHIISGALSLPRFAEQQAKEALTIQPDDAALMAWLGKPVAYIDEQHNLRMGKVRVTGPLYSPKGLVEK